MAVSGIGHNENVMSLSNLLLNQMTRFASQASPGNELKNTSPDFPNTSRYPRLIQRLPCRKASICSGPQLRRIRLPTWTFATALHGSDRPLPSSSPPSQTYSSNTPAARPNGNDIDRTHSHRTYHVCRPTSPTPFSPVLAPASLRNVFWTIFMPSCPAPASTR